MSWTSLLNNQTVSFANAQDAVNNGIFTAKNNLPGTSQLMSKNAVDYFLNITATSTYNAKSSNQLVVKSDLGAVTASYTVLYWYGPSTNTCDNYSTEVNTYYQNNSTGIVYTDLAMTNIFDGGSYWYYGENATSYKVNSSGEIIDSFGC